MQNFLRKQHSNSVSYDQIAITIKYIEAMLPHLHYPIIYDTTRQCLLFLTEVIQGPNLENQEHIINLDFVQTAVRILKVRTLAVFTLKAALPRQR